MFPLLLLIVFQGLLVLSAISAAQSFLAYLARPQTCFLAPAFAVVPSNVRGSSVPAGLHLVALPAVRQWIEE
ncbi:MAG: hypothetical protein H0U76_18625 [Ktedonobacteraceae bacterium]|nr:hypothetical protein [Ktedonobacteraceae bacterium]